MTKDATKVVLVVPNKGLRQAFDIDHAERLLALGSYKNGGWEIEKGSNYYYTREGGIRLRRNKKDISEAGEKPEAD